MGAIAGDSAGNVVVAGSFFDTVNFGGADLQTAVPKSNAGYVVSLDGAGGGYRGNFKVDPGNGNFITQIVAGTGGEVVYGGAWSGNMIQGATLFGKVSAAGGSAWSGDTVGTPTGSYAGIDSIGTDSSGSLYLLDEAHQFSPNGGANGQTGPLLYKLGPAGTFQWSQLIGGYPMAVDSAGNIFCFPTSQGTLAKLDTSRNAVWAKAFSGAGATSFVVDTAGDLFIAALFASSVTYGSTTFTAHGSQDLALFKVDTNGDIVWSRAYGAAGVGMGFSNLTVDGHGDVYFVSTVAGVDFGGGTSAAPSLIVKLDPSGAYQWELSPKTAQVFIGGDSTNHLFVASADKALDLGAGPVLSTTGIAVARLGP